MDNVEKPRTPDYYADLGVSQFATKQQIRKAWRDLAKTTHPDKKQFPSGDAAGFHKVQEAYEVLTNPDKRSWYDYMYPGVKNAWIAYHQHQEARRQEKRRAAALQEARRRHVEHLATLQRDRAARRAAEEEYIRQCNEQREAEIYRMLQARREKFAEERAREAAAREREALKHTERYAAKLESDRLKAEYAKNKADATRGWEKFSTDFRSAAQSTPTSTGPNCAHPRFQWPKQKGCNVCDFCSAIRSKWAFSCPNCSVSACPDCMSRFCRQGQ